MTPSGPPLMEVGPLSLAEFAAGDRVLRVWGPTWGTLFFVPTAADAAALMAHGIPRGRIWTAAELLDVGHASVVR